MSDAALTVCIREIRQRLDDDARAPVSSRLSIAGVIGSSRQRVATRGLGWRRRRLLNGEPASPVARDAELARLHERLARAAGGERHLAFVTGEAGIGKIRVIDAFLARVQRVMTPGSRAASASSTAGLVSPTYRYWTRSGAFFGGPRRSALLLYSANTHQPGWNSCRGS